MWIGLIMMCASPVDVRTCNVMVRTSNFFPTLEACSEQVRTDLDGMGLQNLYTRFQCFEMKQRSI
jgi:hypothetical protein